MSLKMQTDYCMRNSNMGYQGDQVKVIKAAINEERNAA